jgi:transposase-like protein
MNMYTPPQSTAAPVAPDACPFCKSREIKTTSKEVNVSTYWRCTTCGQIWNVDRLHHGHHAPYGRLA